MFCYLNRIISTYSTQVHHILLQYLKPTCRFFKMSQVQIFIPFKCLDSMNCAEHLLSQLQFVTVWFFLVLSLALPDFVLLTNYVNKCGRLKVNEPKGFGGQVYFISNLWYKCFKSTPFGYTFIIRLCFIDWNDSFRLISCNSIKCSLSLETIVGC